MVTDRVSRYIQANELLLPGQRVLAAVSGGADSLCLLDCLHRLGYSLVIAHLDHQLRPESQDEAEYVRKIGAKYGLPVIVERAEVKRVADQGWGIEEAARRVRYQFLTRVAVNQGIRVLATGHTADDQAETILMHFLRGAGAEGLRGMLPSTELADRAELPEARGLRLVRPLLAITKRQTLGHCQEAGLKPAEDPTNQELVFLRNRLRHELLPLLEAYNPGIRQAIRRTGLVMSALAEMVEACVHSLWPGLVRDAGQGILGLKPSAFIQQPVALQRAVLREAFRRLRPDFKDLGFESVERARSLVHGSKTGQRFSLAGGLWLHNLGEEILLRAPFGEVAFPDLPLFEGGSAHPLQVPGEVDLANGWRLIVRSRNLAAGTWRQLIDQCGPNLIALDAETVPAGLALRTPRSGDRIQPLGMKGSIKISKLFIDQHIPQPARRRWPLIVSGEAVVWVARLRMSHMQRITDLTKWALILRLSRSKGGE